MNAFTLIEPANDSGPMIGTACDTPGGGLAYVVAVKPAENATYTLFGGPSPMARDRFTLTIASEAGHISEISENIAAPMIQRARFVAPISEAEAAELWERAKVKREEARRTFATEREAHAAAVDQAKDELQRMAPPWAESAIIAELHQDDCDSMTDYFNARTLRTVVIGWSKHGRDLFPEMRKFAATFAETADLSAAPASAEHREKYSMGAGNYLKSGSRYCSGWAVKKSPLKWLSFAGLEFSEDARAWADMTGKLAPTVDKPQAAPTPAACGRFTLSQHTHSKKGFQMWIASLPGRVDRAEYDRLNAAARELGGWYSRPWAGTPGGFAFKVEAKALAFVAANGGEG
jgi:hypothetical protein